MRRVRTLVTATQKLASGDFRSRSGLKSRAGELGLLAEAFDRMAQELEEHQEERAERIREEAQRTEAVASRQRITSIVESVNYPFLAVDGQWRLAYLNRQAVQVMRQLTGKTLEQLVGQSMWEELPASFRRRFYDQFHQAVADQVSVQLEEFWPELDTWMWVHAHPNSDGLAILFQDITQRKEAEQALRESEERFRLATSAGKVGVWDWNIDTNTVTWSDTLYGIHGLEPGSFGGNVEAFSELVHPDDRDWVQEAIQQALKVNAPYDLEFRTVRPDSGIAWIYTKATVIRDDAGIPVRMLGATVDITERKRNEENISKLYRDLQNLVNELQTVLEVAPVGIGVAEDPQCRVIRTNPAFANLLGIPPDANASKTAEPEQALPFRVFKDGREVPGDELPMQMAARLGVHISGEELDFVREDGSVVNVLVSAAPLLDEAGNPLGSVAGVLDITERKRAEEWLRESEERLTTILE